MATRSKKPKCDESTSQSCGMSCISGKDTCSGGVSADIATKLIAVAVAKRKPVLPTGVTTKEITDHESTKTIYSFELEGNTVNFTSNVYKKSKSSAEIDFDVNNDLMQNNNFDKKARARVAIKISKIMLYDVSTKPEGFKYTTYAALGDKQGPKRTLAYQKIGFAPTDDGVLGNVQRAVVKDGKLMPDLSQSTMSSQQKQAVQDKLLAMRAAAKAS